MGLIQVTIEDGPSDITFQALLGAVVEAAGGSRTDCMAYDRGAGWLKAYHVRLDLTVVVQHESAQVPEGMPGVFTGGRAR